MGEAKGFWGGGKSGRTGQMSLEAEDRHLQHVSVSRQGGKAVGGLQCVCRLEDPVLGYGLPTSTLQVLPS